MKGKYYKVNMKYVGVFLLEQRKRHFESPEIKELVR